MTGGSVTTGTGTLTLGGTVTRQCISEHGHHHRQPCARRNRTFTIADGAAALDMNISAIVSGAFTLTKNGTGTMVLSGANTYTGATTVSAGVLNIQNDTGLGTTAAGTTVSSGATLQLQGGITVGSSETLNINGAGASGQTGALVNVSGTNTYAGLLTLAGATTISSDSGTLSLSNVGTITGATFTLTLGGASNGSISSIIGTTTGGLTKTGTGTWTLSGVNTYTGVTTLTGGVLSVGTIGNGGIAGNLGKATNAATQLVFDGGTLQYTGASASTDRNFTINASKTATFDITTNTLTISGASTATNGALTKIGAGTLTLSGANTYTGATNVTAGTLQISASERIANTSDLNVSGGTFDLQTFSETLGVVTLSERNDQRERRRNVDGIFLHAPERDGQRDSRGLRNGDKKYKRQRNVERCEHFHGQHDHQRRHTPVEYEQRPRQRGQRNDGFKWRGAEIERRQLFHGGRTYPQWQRH